jgi:hypothetical protein
MLELLPIHVKGHVHIQDDLGKVHLDRGNAVHPQNMARVIARSLANESNASIYRIAFGNGGTLVDAAFTVTFNTANDGQPPDVRTWDSRLYNETYAEIIDDSDALLGFDLGSADDTGTRAGGGSVPSGDPAAIEHISGPGVHSNELGVTSEIVITSVLNPAEPTGQFGDDTSTLTEGSFVFDEIGLYTSGAPAVDSNGTADIDVGSQTSEDDTGLLPGTQYSFKIEVDISGTDIAIDFTTPVGGGSGTSGEILYGDLCEAINTGDVIWNPSWASSSPLPGGSKIAITDNTLSFPTITGAQTFGFLRFSSGTTGSTSAVNLSAGTIGLDLFATINPPTGGLIQTPVAGQDAGVQNDPVNPISERERLLSHLVFSPVLKSSNRTLTVTYTLTISVARTVS